MARDGQNPMKWVKEIPKPQRVTLTTIVCIPHLQGYWSESLEVLKLCLRSMRANTQIPFDLIVFDNGSCREVRSYLLGLYERGALQYLFQSRQNLGKVGAWNALFLPVPGEIVSYCDSDVYFFPGWLEASLKILDAFSQAGIVTAQPIAGWDLSKGKTALMAKNDPSTHIEEGVLIPDHYLRACLAGMGASEEEFQDRQLYRRDILLCRNNVQAYATASHFQFTTTKKVLTQLFPDQPELLLGKDCQFEDKMLDLGYWRLSTKEYLVHHMGNRQPDFSKEVPWVKDVIDLSQDVIQTTLAGRELIIGNQLFRRLLKWINIKTYQFLYLYKG